MTTGNVGNPLLLWLARTVARAGSLPADLFRSRTILQHSSCVSATPRNILTTCGASSRNPSKIPGLPAAIRRPTPGDRVRHVSIEVHELRTMLAYDQP